MTPPVLDVVGVLFGLALLFVMVDAIESGHHAIAAVAGVLGVLTIVLSAVRLLT